MGNSQVLGINDFILRRNCPFCESNEANFFGKVYTPLYFLLSKGPVSLSKDVMTKRFLYKCSTCGIVYHSLILKRETLIRLYNDGNQREIWTFNAERNLDKKINLTKTLIRGGRILDVGCHTGEFLRHIGRSKLELWGVELSEMSLKIAQENNSVKMIKGAIEEVELPQNYFNGITMWNVLEHLSEIRPAITNVYNALGKGGILLIETGNISCLPARLLKGNWWYVSILEHFTFYDQRSLQKVLLDIGFQVVDVEHTVYSKARVDIFIKTLINIFFFSVLNVFDKEATIYKKVARLLKKAGYSPQIHWKDHLLVVAKKL